MHKWSEFIKMNQLNNSFEKARKIVKTYFEYPFYYQDTCEIRKMSDGTFDVYWSPTGHIETVKTWNEALFEREMRVQRWRTIEYGTVEQIEAL